MTCSKIKDGDTCVLEDECKKRRQSGGCNFVGHYKNLEIKPSDSPLVSQVKERMRDSFMKHWKDLAGDPKSGKRRMTGGPFEEAIRDVFREKLADVGATVSRTGTKFAPTKGIADICGNVDCLIEKEGYPKSIISAKTGFGAEQVRETFATAYFAKFHYGQQGIRVFMVVYLPFDRNPAWEKDCQPYIDGIYSMAAKDPAKKPPYIDELLQELQRIYAT